MQCEGGIEGERREAEKSKRGENRAKKEVVCVEGRGGGGGGGGRGGWS